MQCLHNLYLHENPEQNYLFDPDESETQSTNIGSEHTQSYSPKSNKNREIRDKGYFALHNRRYLGNKYKLLPFIERIVAENCGNYASFCDIFAGTGVVAHAFNAKNIKVIANDLLTSNYVPLKAFLSTQSINIGKIKEKIAFLNNITPEDSNYFSDHFGNTYFTMDNARKIAAIRENIDALSNTNEEKYILLSSLIYAVDKVANTVGHYDAYRKRLDNVQPIQLLVPRIDSDINERNKQNSVFNTDANILITQISCDVLYIDPPYNSRQYSDAYHLLENLVQWKKPQVWGKAAKMDRSRLKSEYCLQNADKAFAHLISEAKCKHILLSYNNTGTSKDGRSNARIRDEQIMEILQSRGDVQIFEQTYKAFTTGKSSTAGHSERIFYCRVRK